MSAPQLVVPGLRRGVICFMVHLAWVTRPGQSGITRGSRERVLLEATARDSAGPWVRRRQGPGRGVFHCRRVIARAALQRAGFGCRNRAGRQRHFTRESTRTATDWLSSKSMILIGQALTNAAFVPIFSNGMTSRNGARLNDEPDLERSGQALPTRPVRRPPARMAPPSACRCQAAYRSSHLDDQTYVDRRYARGGNPRRGAGW